MSHKSRYILPFTAQLHRSRYSERLKSIKRYCFATAALKVDYSLYSTSRWRAGSS